MADTLTSTRDELRALTRLAFGELSSATGGIGQIHQAIAGRVFRGVERGVGRSGHVVQVAHETIAGGVYGALRGAYSVCDAAAGAAAVEPKHEPRPLRRPAMHKGIDAQRPVCPSQPRLKALHE